MPYFLLSLSHISEEPTATDSLQLLIGATWVTVGTSGSRIKGL